MGHVRFWGRAVSIAAVVVLAVALAPSSVEAKPNMVKVCKDHPHFGVGEDKIKETAIEIASAAWVAEVTAHDGVNWTRIPRPLPVQCMSKDPPKPWPWHCWIELAPCRMQPLDVPATPHKPSVTVNPGLIVTPGN